MRRPEQAPTPCSTTNYTCGPGASCVYTEVEGTVSKGVCLDQTQADLLRGRLAMTGEGRLAILPSFIRRIAEFREFPNTLVYLGACDSMWNGSLATAFYLSGARGITGYSGTVSSDFAFTKGRELFNQMAGADKLLGGALLSEQDPDHEGTWFRLVGATNLDISQSEIINPDFENRTQEKDGVEFRWRCSGDQPVGSVGERVG